MSGLTLIIGNKNYSSWSLRPWLAMSVAGVPFTEQLIPLDEPGTKQEILRHSPSGRVPVLRDGDLNIWDSMAICEYVAEKFPDAKLWPEDAGARAIARAHASEMHSGFEALREAMPMNIRSSYPKEGRKPGVQDDINRITAIWRRAKRRFGAGGDFLYGHFTIVDAMFAPVVTRFRTFGVELGEEEKKYSDAIFALPAMQEWVKAARDEPMVIDSAEF